MTDETEVSPPRSLLTTTVTLAWVMDDTTSRSTAPPTVRGSDPDYLWLVHLNYTSQSSFHWQHSISMSLQYKRSNSTPGTLIQ